MADFKKMTGIASLVINQKRFKLLCPWHSYNCEVFLKKGHAEDDN